MSWHYVYNYVKACLEDPEFVRMNAEHNPNTPEAAVAVALETLAAEYRLKEKAALEFSMRTLAAQFRYEMLKGEK